MRKIKKRKIMVVFALCLSILLDTFVPSATFEAKANGLNFQDAIGVALNTTTQMQSHRYYTYVPKKSAEYVFQFRFASYCDSNIYIFNEKYDEIVNWDPCVSKGTVEYSKYLEGGKRYYIYYRGTRSYIDMTISRQALDGDSFTISSVEEFNEFVENVNDGIDYSGKVVQLTTDIDFGSQTINNFTTPIGTTNYPFCGTFDGGNHTIRGINFINLDKKKISVGLFGAIGSSGVVKNLVLEDISLEGYGFIGGVAENKGLVKNIIVRDSQLNGNGQADTIGGIVAENEGIIDNCHVINTNISNCYNIGGIVGDNYSTGIVKNCSTNGNFQGSIVDDEFGRVGGIASLTYGNIYNCCNMAKIETVSEAGILGGIVGDVSNEAIVQNCYNVGEFGDKGSISGIAAFVEEKCIVANCYSLEETAAVDIAKMFGISKNNKLLSQEEMQTAEFLEQLNLNRGSNSDWLQWEFREESNYPLLMKWMDLSRCEVILDNDSYVYTKDVITPSFKVTDGEAELQENIDYCVSYENNKNAGTGKIIFTGLESFGGYGGMVEKTFTIKKADQKIKYKSSYKKAYNSKAFKVSAKLVTGDGKLTYKSSNKKVATVDSKGKVKIKKAGKAVITVTAAATENYNKKSVKITVQVAGKKKTLERPGGICKSGKYLYYSFDNTGIIRYNPKTGKKKKIRSIKIGKEQGRYFESLSVKNNYLYAAWDKQVGDYKHQYYICRISKDGKKVKKLARGYKPVVIGNYIYYIKTQYNKNEGMDESTNVIMRMKLNGTSKKVVKKLSQNESISRLYRYGNQLVYGLLVDGQEYYYTKDGGTVEKDNFVRKGNILSDDENGCNVGGYKYYTKVSGGYKCLYRKNQKTGKASKILKMNPEQGYSENVTSFYVSGNYILVETFYTHLAFQVDVTKVYCIKCNGKSKKKLGEYNNFMD